MKERSDRMLPLPLLAVSLFLQISASSPPPTRPSTVTKLTLSILFFQVHYFKINSNASITSGDMSCSFNILNRQNHTFLLSIKHSGNCLGNVFLLWFWKLKIDFLIYFERDTYGNEFYPGLSCCKVHIETYIYHFLIYAYILHSLQFHHKNPASLTSNLSDGAACSVKTQRRDTFMDTATQVIPFPTSFF